MTADMTRDAIQVGDRLLSSRRSPPALYFSGHHPFERRLGCTPGVGIPPSNLEKGISWRMAREIPVDPAFEEIQTDSVQGANQKAKSDPVYTVVICPRRTSKCPHATIAEEAREGSRLR